MVGWGLKEAMCWGKASAVGRWPVTHWESVIPFSCNFLCYFQLTAVFSSVCRDHTTSEYKLCHPALPHPLTALSTSPNLLHPKPPSSTFLHQSAVQPKPGLIYNVQTCNLACVPTKTGIEACTATHLTIPSQPLQKPTFLSECVPETLLGEFLHTERVRM